MGERTEIFECDVCLATGPFTLNGHTCDIQWMTDEIPAQRDKIKELEALLRTTVDLLSDTDSLVLEQLTIDIACILPEK